MKKLTRENRAALQSVRAKARKALAVTDAPLTKPIIAHLEAVVAFVDGRLASKVTKLSTQPDDATPGEGQDGGEEQAQAATA